VEREGYRKDQRGDRSPRPMYIWSKERKRGGGVGAQDISRVRIRNVRYVSMRRRSTTEGKEENELGRAERNRNE